MGLTWKKRRAEEDTDPTTMMRRVRRMPTNDLWLWADNLIGQCGQHLKDWRQDGGDDALEEYLLGVEVLHAIGRELKAREMS